MFHIDSSDLEMGRWEEALFTTLLILEHRVEKGPKSGKKQTCVGGTRSPEKKTKHSFRLKNLWDKAYYCSHRHRDDSQIWDLDGRMSRLEHHTHPFEILEVFIIDKLNFTNSDEAIRLMALGEGI